MVIKNTGILFSRSKTYPSAFLLLLFLSAVFLPGTGAAGDKIPLDFKSRMLEGESVPVIIVLKDQPSLHALSKENAVTSMKSLASESQKSLASVLKDEKSRGKADKIKQFWIVNAIATEASPELIERLAKREDVERIELDSELRILEVSTQVSQGQIDSATSEIKRINATKVWELGIDGTGINVSVIDTGINASHPDIAGRVIKWVDFVNSNNASAYDDNGHGTHVAGTVGGNGSRGTTTGVAPNVSLFGVKVLNSAGSGTFSNVTAGIQWSVENNANVISMSLGGGNFINSNCDSSYTSLANAINNAVALNVTVIAAAGNDGSSGVSSPGCISKTIAVGAVGSSDAIASFSSTGFSMSDHGVIAPGVNITSLNYL
ncbi:MAG: S8 family serine peptidase, partial [Candidatus Methanoperedens sp.]|nr:S8 family serine peptidase [Candidatus Methanoperedens sp.]